MLGNHDVRIATRVRPEGARLAAMLLLTLRGTPTLYYGDEIGMEDVPSRRSGPRTRRAPSPARPRPGAHPDAVGASPNAGFCPAGAEPWLPLGGDLERVNVVAQRRTPAPC